MTENQVNSWGDKISMRYESNQKIIEILSKLVERFQQILQNVDIASRDGEDLFYEESYDTLTTLINNPTVSAILSQTDN